MSKNLQKRTTSPRRAESAGQTKTDKVIALLRRNNGGTIAELTKATGWQRHSVHGFMSGTLKKKRGMKIISTKDGEQERRYLITAGAE